MVAVNSFSNSTLSELRDEVERFRQFRQQLAQRLVDAADQLAFPGFPPAASLIDDLLTCRRRMQRLASALGSDAETSEDGVSLNEIERLIESRDYRQSAEAVLDRLMELTHVDVPDFAPLALCQREASRLCELAVESFGVEKNPERPCTKRGSDPVFVQSHPELELLKSQRHPLNALIRLCDEGGHLSDTDWTECHDDVAATYGRQLATALTRGRIVRKSTAGQIDRQETIFEPASETVFDVAPVISSSAAQLRMALFPPEISPVSGEQPVSFRHVAITGGLTPPRSEKTAVVLASDEASFCGTSDHIIRLMTEGRLSLALQLTRCLEQRAEQSDGVPPSWLLRALILGRHLSYSRGEIARQLDDELREFRAEPSSGASDEHRLAMSFLLRAAALPATLLAGSAPATGILRSFKIAPGFSQLYNYCSRIALYGDRLAGNLVEMFRPAGTIAGASELEDLGLSAQHWLQETAKETIGYSRTSPLFLHAHWTLTSGTAVRHAESTGIWCKWQETLSLAHRLLKPVCDGAAGERNWVRQEVARLTSQVRVEPLDQSFRAGPLNSQSGRGIILPLEEMHAVILEAVAIANRWLRFCHQTASGGASPIPLEALELRDEIMKRSDGVLSELTQQRIVAESPAVKAAIACCQSAVRHIQAMFESRLELPLVEPDPRHVLNADLLRLPGIELNDQWLPETEPAIVEREVIAILEQAPMTWRQTYDYHAQAGNHEATGRVLDLDVWSSPDECESLRTLRQTQIDDNRLAVDGELDELAADIATVNETGTWSDSDRVAIQKRLERLRYELPRAVNFRSFRRQVNQLQSAILRQRTGSGLPIGPLAGPPDPEVADPRRKQLAGTASFHQSVIQSCDIFSGE